MAVGYVDGSLAILQQSLDKLMRLNFAPHADVDQDVVGRLEFWVRQNTRRDVGRLGIAALNAAANVHRCCAEFWLAQISHGNDSGRYRKWQYR